MKQPLAPLALVYAAGLLIGHFIEAPILPSFIGGFLMLLIAFGWAAPRAWLLIAALFVFGWLNLTVHTARVSPHDLRTLAGDKAQIASVRGVLVDTPSERVFISDEKESWRTLAELKLEAVQLQHGRWQPAAGHVLTITSGTMDPTFVKGHRVEVEGVLMRPPPPVAVGLFDYRQYLASKGMSHELKVESGTEWKSCGTATSAPFTSRFRSWGQRTLARGLPVQDEALRLQWAMLLGWQTALTSEVSEPFMRSGTMHIFAISGLHIALIAGIFAAVLRALTLSRFWCGFVVIPLIWFYTAATGWQPSAIRSTVMMSVIIAGWMLHRPSNLLNSLATAALIILVWDPMQLFQASFQLSFFVVLSLALLLPLMESIKEKWLEVDPFRPYALLPASQRRGLQFINHAWTWFSTSLAAFLGSLPLIAFYFHLFTPGSLLANVLVVPVSGLALMSGLGALCTGSWCPLATEWFNHSGWFFMRVMIWLCERFTELPGGWMNVRAPGFMEFTLYYLVLFTILAWSKMLRRIRQLALVSIGMFACGILLRWTAWQSSTEIAVMPLTGTHTVLTREAWSSRYSLMNCGSHSSFNILLKPYLQAHGINRLRHLTIARMDMPHASAILDLHTQFPLKAATAAPQRSLSSPFRELLASFEKQVTVAHNAARGATIHGWRVLHPDPEEKVKRGDDGPVCLVGTFDGVRVLLLPDLGFAGQNALFNRNPDLRADIVIAGLPDSGEPLATEMIEQLQPKLVIIADTEFPAVRRASPLLRARLRRTGVPTLYTRESGAVTLLVKDRRWTVTVSRPASGPR